jgi:hypothetical protein
MGNVLQSLAPYVLLLVVLILAVGIAALVSMPQRPADEKFTLILLAELSYGLGLAVSALISSHFHAVVQGISLMTLFVIAITGLAISLIALMVMAVRRKRTTLQLSMVWVLAVGIAGTQAGYYPDAPFWGIFTLLLSLVTLTIALVILIWWLRLLFTGARRFS